MFAMLRQLTHFIYSTAIAAVVLAYTGSNGVVPAAADGHYSAATTPGVNSDCDGTGKRWTQTEKYLSSITEP